MTTADREGVRSFLDQRGLPSWLGGTVETVGSGRGVLSVPARNALRTFANVGPFHGGVVAVGRFPDRLVREDG